MTGEQSLTLLHLTRERLSRLVAQAANYGAYKAEVLKIIDSIPAPEMVRISKAEHDELLEIKHRMEDLEH